MGPRSDNRGYAGCVQAWPRRTAASRDPRSDSRGYATPTGPASAKAATLQWVHGQITVVMEDLPQHLPVIVDASMGPLSDNRGYVNVARQIFGAYCKLQWVHGQITVVMTALGNRHHSGVQAS